METNFLKNMDISGILHGSFARKIHAAFKILHKIACNMKDFYKKIMQNFDAIENYFRMKKIQSPLQLCKGVIANWW